MKVYNITDSITVLKGTKNAEPKYRTEISARVLEKFGAPPYSTETITEILKYFENYYIGEFEARCRAEKSFTFYKEIFRLNEMATDLRRSKHFHRLPKGLDKSYIAVYRRILKMILEQGCDVEMEAGEKRDEKFQHRITPVINDLLYLGQMLLGFTESIAEQFMIEDISDINFDAANLYVRRRRHHYDPIFRYMQEQNENLKDEYVIDPNGSADFRQAIKSTFGFEYEELEKLFALLHVHFEINPPVCLTAEKQGFLMDAINHWGISRSQVETFVDGLTLSRSNKMALAQLIKKPYAMNRFLHRPLLLWKINGKEYYAYGIYSFNEAENSLLLNAIPWGKFPKEWEQYPGFVKYVNRKKDEHDKWLDDIVENILLEGGFKYQRSVKKIHTAAKSYAITGKGLGEIDFLVICPDIRKVIVTECKHLAGRYDMVNWKNDYDHFTVDGKQHSYNSRIAYKVDWIKSNLNLVEEHFRRKYNDDSISLSGYEIEGIFIINIPTFYMYNCDFRIYTYHNLKNVITGNYIDPVFHLVDIRDDAEIIYKASFPYFRKPKMFYFEMPDEDVKYDKYGYPIKPT